MKRKLTAMLVVVILFVPACTTTYDLTTSPRESHPWMETQYRTYQDFLSDAKGKTVRIVLTNGKELLATVTRADSDSVGWTSGKDLTTEDANGWMEPAHPTGPNRTDSTAISAQIVPTSHVQRLEISHNYLWQGGLIGLVGFTVPTVIAGEWNVPRSGHSGAPNLVYLERSIGWTLIGTGLGIVVGNTIYHTNQYLTSTNGSADTTQSHSHH